MTINNIGIVTKEKLKKVIAWVLRVEPILDKHVLHNSKVLSLHITSHRVLVHVLVVFLKIHSSLLQVHNKVSCLTKLAAHDPCGRTMHMTRAGGQCT